MPASFLATPESKRDYNRSLFDVVAPKYAIATLVLSLGRDSAWKRRAIALLPRDIPGGAVVDVASGSGDLALLLSRRYGRRRCIAADLNPAMTRAASARLGPAAALTIQDMSRLGLADSSAAIVCGGYALRNAPDLPVALAEFYRVMQPGASAVFLEFSRSPLPAIAFYQHIVLKAWGLLWGLLLHGSPRVYGYIADSLAAYPDTTSLHALCRQTGFSVEASERRMFGLIEILLLKKAGALSRPGCDASLASGLTAGAARTPRPWLPDLSVRSREKELMDDRESEQADLHRTLHAFRLVNLAVSPFRRVFEKTVLADTRKKQLKKVLLCELGAGGGDIGQWCSRRLRRRGIAATVLYVDADWRVARFLKDRVGNDPFARVICADAAAGCLKRNSVDYSVSNHMLHHLDESQVTAVLKNMREASRFGFVAIDLLRKMRAYFGFRILATLFFRTGFTLYDGLLSIRRGFTMGEMAAIVQQAGGEGRIKVRSEGLGHFCMSEGFQQ